MEMTPEFRVETATVAHVHKPLRVDVGEIGSPSLCMRSHSLLLVKRQIPFKLPREMYRPK